MKNFQIIANFKMNGSFDMISSWLDEVSLMPEDLQSRCILCPPMCFLKSTSNPEGQPSITPPIAKPCDSPKVVNLKICPIVFPIAQI